AQQRCLFLQFAGRHLVVHTTKHTPRRMMHAFADVLHAEFLHHGDGGEVFRVGDRGYGAHTCCRTHYLEYAARRLRCEVAPPAMPRQAPAEFQVVRSEVVGVRAVLAYQYAAEVLTAALVADVPQATTGGRIREFLYARNEVVVDVPARRGQTVVQEAHHL